MGVILRWPLLATALVCAASVTVTGLVSGFSRAFMMGGPGVSTPPVLGHPLMSLAESVVFVAWIFVLTWKVPPRVAWVCVAALLLVSAHAQYFRLSYLYYRTDTVQMALLAGAVAAGAGVVLRMRDRSRAALAAAAEERARRDERLDMARELHDVVAHHVTGMLVQAQAALVVAEQDKDKACELLPGIVDGGTDALGAMRAMVRTLRDNGAATATGDLTSDLQQLVEKSGLPVRTSIELTEDVRPELGRSVLRLVQEALTNARKHAHDATNVEVDVRLTSAAVLLSVVDNGTTRPAHSGGFGLVGMRERVHELGGRFFAGATGEGWLVTAELPLEVRA
ncbi:histidine kinase [Lentzea sp. BCCO 10_0856]|uniref:histidine kinase n=1 Tax=Lentzea miocenica TaxID=3095431 RepID=A0ABU4SXE6_9PSEU|nr:histidine kinase [Lentzea sp. BCCO 10_0856]MDX8030584.1 histidine kinase [Lentzea sp. BCCO 10_0856]